MVEETGEIGIADYKVPFVMTRSYRPPWINLTSQAMHQSHP
jgi:hypothetical protein